MYRLLACPRGHQWEASEDSVGGTVTPAVCPVCGVAAPHPIPAARSAPPTTNSPPGTEESTSTQHVTAAPMPEDSRTVAPSAQSAGPARVAVPGYEILKELGRGGMGVVYQARHVGLNRIVALKMIRTGACVEESDLVRFHTEAEAIARLQHPGVVQIYEIGQYEGLPYLSLEFCGAGSLDRLLRGTPLPPEEAARIVELVADAMQAAHANQIIHRDLKPANILMSSALSGSWSIVKEGDSHSDRFIKVDHEPRTKHLLPKVTDFGIAKRLDQNSGQTARGMILGTPSYMAPEQVTGTFTDIGPATDIYALGAILYELLTGRPPFRAPTVLETTMHVVQREPVAPSKLQPCTPRDVETICLKCLQKLPGRRYASATDLADDLRRFQAGEPIRARPVGVVERTARWCRRNPLVPIAVAVLLLTVAVGAVVRIERHQLQTIGQDTGPSIIAAHDIQAGLADMHRHAAERLLIGAGGGAEAAAAYEARRMHTSEAILDAAGNITYGEAERGPLRQLIHLLGAYEQAVARAITLSEMGDPGYLPAQREADHVMQQGLLPAAHALDVANREYLDRACAGRPRASALALVCVALGAGVVLAVLGIALWRVEAIRWSPSVYGAMALIVVLLVAAITALRHADVCLHRACADAFQSMYVLQQARADAFDAHGQMCRALLDPSAAATHEQQFSERAAKVLTLPAGMSHDALAAALNAGTIPEGLDGYLAAALRNVTFEGERESAVATVDRFSDYLDIAARVRRLTADGQHKDAVALCVGRGPGQGTQALAEFNTALVKTMNINRREFDHSISQGFDTLGMLDAVNPLAALAVLALAYVGVRGRASRSHLIENRGNVPSCG
jgi:serine/threonine protein kinase